MKVSIIIPVYNEGRVIGACLESLDLQSFDGFEVVLVDDGSMDSTLKIARGLRVKNYELRTLQQKHKGPGLARNLGSAKSKGEVLVFVDADMTFDKDFIKELVAPITKKNEKGTFSKNEYISNWENVWARCWNVEEGWPEKKRHPDKYPNEQKVFRAILKSEFDRVGGFDSGGHYTDDWSLSEKLGYKAKSVNGAKFYHANPENLSEIFTHSRWVSKREYKMGVIGAVFVFIRTSLPVSIIVALVKSIAHLNPHFFVFKIVYDLGSFIGILEFKLLSKKGR